MAFPAPLEQLIEAFERFPGIGRVTAERLSFHILRDPEAAGLAGAIERAARDTLSCAECGNIAEQDPCVICSDPKRDRTQLCVVEEPRHVEAIERSGAFGGVYHVLMGALNPAEGTEIAQLSIKWLVERVGAGEVREVVFATDPDVEGEATALAAVEALEAGLSERPVMTRLARGVPSGGALEYLHRGVLMDAFEGRRTIGAKR